MWTWKTEDGVTVSGPFTDINAALQGGVMAIRACHRTLALHSDVAPKSVLAYAAFAPKDTVNLTGMTSELRRTIESWGRRHFNSLGWTEGEVPKRKRRGAPR